MARAAGLAVALIFCFAVLASAQFGGKRPPPPKAPVWKEDIKYIRCQVCEAMAKQALRTVKSMKDEAGAKRVRLNEPQAACPSARCVAASRPGRGLTPAAPAARR